MRLRLRVLGIGAVLGAAAAAAGASGAAEARAADSADASDAAAAEPPLVALGRRLFFDPTVSRSGKVACASCHRPEQGWSDARTVPEDADGPMRRHSQPVTDLGGKGFHWDGEFATPRDLVVARVGDERTARLAEVARAVERSRLAGDSGGAGGRGGSYGFVPPSEAPAVVAAAPVPVRLGADRRYASAFAAAFGDDAINSERIVDAVDAFVRSLRTERNAFDRHLAGEAAALSAEAKRGLELFRGRASCATCHSVETGEDGRAAMTDGKFHNTGVAFTLPRESALGSNRTVEVRRIAFNGNFDSSTFPFDTGRQEQSFAPADTGAFKTPSLRDVARRAPYMHDGSLGSLEDVVRYYSKGGTKNEHLDPAIRELNLSDGEVGDLVAFLESLSGERRAGFLPARSDVRRMRVRVVDPSGAPLRGVPIDVVPSGERLGDDSPLASTTLTTGADGMLTFDFPQTTHVVLRHAPGLTLDGAEPELAGGRPIPDTASELEATLVPAGRIAVALRGDSLPERLTGTVADAGGLFLRGDEWAEVRGAETPAGAPVVEFERVRILSPTESVYVAATGAAKGRRALRFAQPGGPALVATVDLDGGASLPATLRPVAVVDVEPRLERPRTMDRAGDPVPAEDGR